MRLRELAYTRSGDKGDVSNICVFPYNPVDFERLKAALTAAKVKAFFGELVLGDVTRYEYPNLRGLNFVMERALGGGVSISLRTDPHGKTFQSMMLYMELDWQPEVGPVT